VLPALVLAALAALPATVPPTDLPSAADPCVALTPSVVNQLRTSGALTPLVSDEVPTSTLIVKGRALTGCPPTNDPDPATVRAHVCPLLTAEGVEALANRFKATPAVRADLGPERVATARSALQCDSPSTTTSEATAARGGAVAAETSTHEDSSDTANQADRGVLQQPAATAIFVVIAALIGVLVLIGRATRHRQSVGESGASRNVQFSHHSPEATRPEGQRATDAADGRSEGHQQSTPEGESDVRGRLDEHSDSYDELLAGLRREVAELQRADEAFRTGSRKPDHPHEP
jgi:hypothetical protein